tara:strand:- start:169 stop:462 length:294 start_codon:yes stop_codon:yes gene_type:complete
MAKVRTTKEENELALETFRVEFRRMWDRATDLYSSSDAASDSWRYLPEYIKKSIANNKDPEWGRTALAMAKEAHEAAEDSVHYLYGLIAELRYRLED